VYRKSSSTDAWCVVQERALKKARAAWGEDDMDDDLEDIMAALKAQSHATQFFLVRIVRPCSIACRRRTTCLRSRSSCRKCSARTALLSMSLPCLQAQCPNRTLLQRRYLPCLDLQPQSPFAPPLLFPRTLLLKMARRRTSRTTLRLFRILRLLHSRSETTTHQHRRPPPLQPRKIWAARGA
jgi:hypothetical protein